MAFQWDRTVTVWFSHRDLAQPFDPRFHHCFQRAIHSPNSAFREEQGRTCRWMGKSDHTTVLLLPSYSQSLHLSQINWTLFMHALRATTQLWKYKRITAHLFLPGQMCVEHFNRLTHIRLLNFQTSSPRLPVMMKQSTERRPESSWCQDNKFHPMSTKQRSWSWTSGRGIGRNTPPSPSVGLQWRESATSGSLGVQMSKGLT